MKALLVGMGAMGRRHHDALLRNNQIEEIITVDPNPDVSAQYLSIVEAITKHEIDLGIVASPTSFHKDNAATLLENGISVLIEKPVALSTEEAQVLVKLARQNNCRAAVGHIERQNPAIKALMEDLDQAPRTVTLKRTSPYPARITDVGVALDLSIHDIDLARYITGAEVVGVTSVLQSIRNRCEDSAMYLLELDNGAAAAIHTSWLSPFRERSANVTTPTGVYSIDMLRQQATKYTDTPEANFAVTGLFVRREDQLDSQLTAFIQYVLTGAPTNLCLLEDGIRALAIVEESLDESMH